MARRRSGQSTAEYAILIAIVIAAVVGMQVYVKRGLQAKEKHVTDHFTSAKGSGAGALTAATSQYEPYYAQSNFVVGQNEMQDVSYKAGGAVLRDITKDQTTRQGGSVQDTDQGADTAWK